MEAKKDGRMHARDWAIVLVVTLLYAALALWNLGDTKAAQNGYVTQISNEQITFDFGETESLSTMQFYSYSLTRELTAVSIEGSLDGQTWFDFESQTRSGKKPSYGYSSEFCWQDALLWQTSARYVRITVPNADVVFFEMAFTQSDGGRLLPVQVTSTASGVPSESTTGTKMGGTDLRALFDEQELVPERSTFMNSTYFDEIYHARSAYEMLHGLPIYETTHPPLGKMIIEACIAVLGMTPFAWRLPGTLAGVLMLPLLYAMAKLLFRRRSVAIFALLAFTFECMHFSQTRIATIDSFVLLFILAMFYFLFRYVLAPDAPDVPDATRAVRASGLSSNPNAAAAECAGTGANEVPTARAVRVESSSGAGRLDATRTQGVAKLRFRSLHACDLLCAGVAMGLACATKWIGFYAAVGAVIVLFGYWIRLGIAARGSKAFWRWWGKTAGLCVLFFLVIPFCIYFASFAQYYTAVSTALSQFWNEQVSMLSYHTQLVDKHYYSSSWYEWPLDWMPMLWYSAKDVTGNTVSAINTMGNPIVWWTGLVAMEILIVHALVRLVKYLRARYSARVVHRTPEDAQGAADAQSVVGVQGAADAQGATARSDLAQTAERDDVCVQSDAPTPRARRSLRFPYEVRVAWLIAVGYLCLYVPWMLVPRLTFIYHYFACTPFLVLALVYLLRCGMASRSARLRRAAPIVAVVLLVVIAFVFALFYPVLSGLWVPKGYIAFTRWLPWWIIWC